ncbi:MAG: NAD-dependent epimerase/dehydratase family protein [Planctomycetes bacterium]|nr:NAD-dependent epimerase/dehydratase family protein [Planctomycetota bacterium]
MNILILGFGTVGTLTAAILRERGHRVVGVRRSPGAHGADRVIMGDLAAPELYADIASERFDAVLLAANPGIRRGRDNRLAAGAALVNRHLPHVRLIYTGTTAVYADAGGSDVQEDGPVDLGDPATVALLAIERAVIAHGDALVLRCPALVGPTRSHARERLERGETSVRGSLERPFSFLHEQDCAELCADALVGAFGSGMLNAASPRRLSVRDYYGIIGADIGGTGVVGDGAPAPARWIDAGRLHAMCPTRIWRDPG